MNYTKRNFFSQAGRTAALLSFLLVIMAMPAVALAQVYVNHAATGDNNGSSWADAYTDLQQALANTTSGQIWVAAGVYKPTSTTDRTISFELQSDVAIYGGFDGGKNRAQPA